MKTPAERAMPPQDVSCARLSRPASACAGTNYATRSTRIPHLALCDGDAGLHPSSRGFASTSLPARDQRVTTRLLRCDSAILLLRRLRRMNTRVPIGPVQIAADESGWRLRVQALYEDNSHSFTGLLLWSCFSPRMSGSLSGVASTD
ncbi:unnamed protein product [Trichogramma brassicae]|uniref:Uncharacterized protein n=1 Tax=Trichogramma brassicae TaxID=86971 RepID=A0A6H5J3D6_9HYME|nr:unnamed protein product [Trichogramma brassicae]